MAYSWKTLKEVFRFDKEKHNFEFLFQYLAKNLDYVGFNYQLDTWPYSFKNKAMTCAKAIPLLCYYLANQNALRVAENTQDFASAVMGFTFFLYVVPKLFIVLINHKNFKSLAAQVILNTNNSYTGTKMETNLRIKYVVMASIITKTYTASLLLIIAILVLSPLVFIKQFMLPIKIKIPGVSTNSHPGFEVHWALASVMPLYHVPFLFGYDLGFFYIAIYVAFRLDVYCLLCKEIGRHGDAKKDQETLLKLIKLHYDTYAFIKKCSMTMATALLFQLAGTVLVITFSLYLFILDPYVLWPYSLLGGGLFQFFVYCFFGQLVLTKVEEASLALYCSDWYNLTSISQQRMVLFALIHTQSPLSINAYRLFDLSLETFTQIVKAAVGYFTFLRNVF